METEQERNFIDSRRIANEWHYRLNRLKLHIKYWSNEINMTDKMVEIVHLFFDE